MPVKPTLLIAAHGTASAAGSATTAALVAAVAAARPEVAVSLCFLDVASPRLADALLAHPEPTVVVPLLLSSGFHVLTDIPAVVAGHPAARVARHLGPDPLVVSAVIDRLASARGPTAVATTVLVAAGSSNPAAALDSGGAADLLAEHLGRRVSVLTMADDLAAALGAAESPVEVACYLLTEGKFVDTIRAAARTVAATVSDPIGVHLALVSLVLARYDEVLAAH